MIPETVRQELRPFRGGRPAGRFVALPKAALTWGLSLPASVGYALMLDRVGLSLRSGWLGENGQPYIHYSLAALARDVGVSETTARGLLRELEDNGLLRREGRRGKASRLYLFAPGHSAPEPVRSPAGDPEAGWDDVDWLLRRGAAEDRDGDPSPCGTPAGRRGIRGGGPTKSAGAPRQNPFLTPADPADESV